MTEQLTLGVIGHVDHGKSALVHALTGIHTDRLREEKDRGLSIVLGFAYLHRSHRMIDLIDVPGHRDFVKTMVSGATGIDGALLVVAANEGVMPQTREHVDITRLLGVNRGLIAITKCDLVSSEELELAIDDVRSFVTGTFLEGAHVIPCSAVTQVGLDELATELDQLEVMRGADSGQVPPFLSIDRVFVMQGFGPVVTGTLRGGRLETDCRVELLPDRRSASIRGLQVHNETVNRAGPGQRVAINLRNIKREDIRRGDVITLPGAVETTQRVDVELYLLDRCKRPLRNAAIVRLLAGTTEVMARIRILDGDTVEPGATRQVQLRLASQIALLPMERFVIRSYSPVETIGGGRVLDAHASRHRRFDAAVIEHLHTAASGTTKQRVRMLLAEAGLAGTTQAAISEALGLDAGTTSAVMASIDTVRVGPDKLVDAAMFAELKKSILNRIARYHADQPNRQGIPAGRLRKALADRLADDVFQNALQNLASDQKLVSDSGVLHMVGFDPLAKLNDKERRVAAEIENTFRDSGLAAPKIECIVGRDKTRQGVFRLLCDTGRLVRLRTHDRNRTMVLHSQTLDDVIAEVRTHFSYPRKFALTEVRQLLGSTRKYTVPLMEHLDATGVTLRMGNLRQIGIQYRT